MSETDAPAARALTVETRRATPHARFTLLFAVEALTSVGTNLLSIGIFFYTAHEFGWGLRQNFLLAAGQGVIYVVGALAAARLTARRRRQHAVLAAAYAMMGLIVWAAAVPGPRWAFVGVALAYTLFNGISWPILESLVSAGAPDARTLSRRVSAYNVVWAGVGAVTLAVVG